MLVDINQEDLSYRIAFIPKKGSGVRKIYIPSKDLKKKQRRLLRPYEKALNDLLGDDLKDTMHGFRSYKNPCSGAFLHIGYSCTVMMDIKDFFDTCHRSVIQPQLPSVDNICFNPEGYLGQGFCTSPILANIALVPVLRRLKALLDLSIKDYKLTVYADDIQISLNPDEGFDKQNAVVKLTKMALEEFNFKMKDSKTRIRYAKHGFRRILGVNVGEDKLYPTRKLKRKMRAAKHQNNYRSYAGLSCWAKYSLPRTKEECLKAKAERKAKAKPIDNPF